MQMHFRISDMKTSRIAKVREKKSHDNKLNFFFFNVLLSESDIKERPASQKDILVLFRD